MSQRGQIPKDEDVALPPEPLSSVTCTLRLRNNPLGVDERDKMQSGAAFASTNWSMVLLAHDDPGAMDRLMRQYLAPIYAYVRRTGRTPDQAADLTQDFVATVVLERALIQKADPERGRFRAFVKSALSHFLIDEHRRATARFRAAVTPALPGLRLDDFEPDAAADPTTAFDRQWAGTLLAVALARVEADCRECGQGAHWDAFCAVVIDPTVRQTSAPKLTDIATRLGLSEPGQVSSMIQTVRRKFRRMLRKAVEDTVADPALAAEEFQELKILWGL